MREAAAIASEEDFRLPPRGYKMLPAQLRESCPSDMNELQRLPVFLNLNNSRTEPMFFFLSFLILFPVFLSSDLWRHYSHDARRSTMSTMVLTAFLFTFS